VSSNPGIADIAIVSNDGHIITVEGVFNQVEYSKLKTLYDFEKLDSGIYPPILNRNKNSLCYYYITPMYNIIGNDRNRTGTCIILCKIKQLDDIVKHTSVSENSQFFILDSNSTVIISNKNEMQFKFWDFMDFNSKDKTDENITEKYKGKLSIIQLKHNNEMNWKTVSIIPVGELTDDMKPIRESGIFIGILTAILLSIIGYIFIKNITNPIAQMVKGMSEIGEKNIKQRLKVKVADNEVGIIVADINVMLDNVENMTKNIFNMQNKMYEMELGKKESEISSLQSQINPHFLYNTLECLRSIGMVYNVPEVTCISTAMAKIFRYSIKGDGFTTLDEEIKMIEEYIKIIEIRFADKISAEISIPDDLRKVRTIKMILQPIVENAVYHGLEQKDEHGTLKIVGIITNGDIEIQIIDDGVGMNIQDVEKINNSFKSEQGLQQDDIYSKRSIGLSNINARIKLHYGNKYGLKIYSIENEGTRVVVKLPIGDSTL
jgi:two-component system sensor histidine kinase YesM